MSVEMTEQHVVCAGKRMLADGKTLGISLVPLKQAQDADAGHVFSNLKTLRHAVVGGIYTLQATADFSTIKPELTWVQAWDDERVAGWKVKSRAAEAAHALVRDEASARRRDRLAELLEPIAREYRRASTIERLAIEAQLLHALRYGK